MATRRAPGRGPAENALKRVERSSTMSTQEGNESTSGIGELERNCPGCSRRKPEIELCASCGRCVDCRKPCFGCGLCFHCCPQGGHCPEPVEWVPY